MKRTLFFIFSLFLASVPPQAQPIAPYLPAQAKKAAAENAPITVQFPYENMKVSRGAKAIFIFGQVHLPQPATLTINGQAVELYKNGSFMAFLPVQSGTFTFTLTATHADQTVQAVRHIQVPGTDIRDYLKKASFDKEEIFPQRKVELLPGDTVNLYARGTPGARVTASLPSLKEAKNIALQEDITQPGIYRGTFVIDENQKEKTSKIVYKMTQGPRRSKAKITAPAKLTVRNKQEPFTYAHIVEPGVKLRKRPTASGNLYPDYRAYGTVRINGEMADQYRLQLSDKEQAWLEKKHLKTAKKPQEENRLSFIRTQTTPQHTRLTFTLDRAVPIQIHEYEDRVELTLYDIDEFTQNFSLDDTSPVLADIQWAEPAEKAVAFRFNLRKKANLWGYAYNFEDNELIVDLIHPPLHAAQAGKPLAGVRVLLDAGHSPRRQVPYDGAIGPSGYLEYEATLALAEDLKPLLEKAGATVIMTRRGNNPMTLQQRYVKAVQEDVHLFVSLHYNALPETTDPFARPRGFSVYYNYPHSVALAKSVHQAFTKQVPLPDDGLLQNDVLFIPRISQFPSILVENAYLILPEQETLARTQEGRAPFVKALYEGILNFYNATPANVYEKRRKPRK